FDPRSPLLRLRPPPSAVDDLVALVNDAALVKAWGAPDTLGWTYQFFNSDEERSAMRRAHPQPQDSRELAVRNQFFTPDYVVGFLVHNSLGRRLIEGGFAELADDLGYLVDRPVPGSVPLDLAGVRVLDPAVGSGHFLLGAYDLLERAWALRGVGAGDAAPMILEALWGIDIDARAAQVAAAALVFRARRHRPDGTLPVPNVVCARAVPGGPAARADLLASVDPSRRDFLVELMDLLDRAPELGSLLKVEELLTGDVARRMAYGGGSVRGRGRPARQDTSLMDDAIAAGALDVESLVAAVLSQAQAAADRVTSTPAERVLAADGGDALRLVTALAQRYDAVLMNPPFGEPIPGTKAYLKAAYPWIPTRDYNLFAAFVGRGVELCKPDGYVGAITSRAGMFLTTFERWREKVLLGNDLTVLADLGHKVMHEALVEAAAYVVRRGRSESDHPATFIRLLREAPDRRPQALTEVCAHARAGEDDGRVFRVAPAAFDAVPGSPMAYWVSPDIRRLFTDFPSLEGHGADVRVGLQTGDDFRFVRAFWEVDPARIARTREETFADKRWVPFAKGGEYSPFWSDIHLVVDFERDGEQLRRFPGARPQNLQYFFRPGLTWPRRTASGFSPRVMPSGCAFADKGPAVIPIADPLTVLGWLGSRTAAAMLAVQLGAADETSGGGASKSYEVGIVAKLPWPDVLQADQGLQELVRRSVTIRRALDANDEASREFAAPWPKPGGSARSVVEARVRSYEDDVLALVTLSAELEAIVLARTGATGAAGFVEQEIGTQPASYARRRLSAAEAGWMLTAPLEQAIADATRRRGAVRVLTQKNFVADRRIEVVAHAFEVHPESVVELRRATGEVAPELSAEAVTGLFSYLVGCAFGRWDVRIGRDPSSAPAVSDDPFAPVPVCPPGMLVGPDGFPAREAPTGYPLAFTPHRLLVDEVGHPADIVAAIEAAAAALVDDPGALLDELTRLLGVADLRTYLRKRFFKDHVSRYSKSRRKAPIYWPLTIPSRGWTVWLYAPVLSREALYGVAAHAERRWNGAEAEMRRLESAQLQATDDPARARSLASRLDTERRLGEELRTLHKLLAAVAGSGWVPDLDDGIVVCAAPLTDALLDWPKDPGEARAQLRAGKLAWATAHRWREAL
ncbi:MAG: Eco57I restriction-modification methylase domain-containing protein, partial [Acidimicrobiales bacterium]